MSAGLKARSTGGGAGPEATEAESKGMAKYCSLLKSGKQGQNPWLAGLWDPRGQTGG